MAAVAPRAIARRAFAGVNDRPELRALTSMRGIAAWFVVLYHIRYSIAGLSPGMVAVLGKGYLAVDFFFLLSGFVIWLAWHDRLRSGGQAAVPAFLLKRVARIWPLHLLLLGGAVMLALLLAVTGHADPQAYPFAELPLNVLLLHGWGMTRELAWNVPSWSISVELAAYLAFPVLVVALDWRHLPSAVLLIVSASLLLLLHLGFATHGATTLGHDIEHLGIVRCLVEFGVGTILCALWQRWRERSVLAALVAMAVMAAALVGWAAGTPETLAVPIAFAAGLLLLALTAGGRHHPLEGRALHMLGEISYATYLSHFLLFVVFKLALVDDARDVPPVLIALYLALVLCASFALYHLFEKPAQRWVERLPRRIASGTNPGRRSLQGHGRQA